MELLILYCIIAIAVCFVCSIMESVFLSITPSFVASYEKSNPKIGGRLKELKNNVDDAEGAILVLNTFGVTATSTGVGIEVAHIFGTEWQSFGAIILTIVLIYACEIFPKTLGATHWKSFVPIVTLSIHYLLKITFPFVWIAKLITRFVKPKKGSNPISREEILAASQIGQKGGSITAREQNIIENLLELKNYQAFDILTPRSVVFALHHNITIKEVLALEGIYHHSQIPVYGESVDNIIGIVLAVDILEEGIKKEKEKKIYELMRPVHTISLDISVLNLLNLFMSKKERFFAVQDAYEQLIGIVTLEDVIETLLGEEIIDEFDKTPDMQKLAREKIKGYRLKYLSKLK
ncbi:DUF21 domain-containing protein [Helicobacter sp. MIT 03-1614]|uniref:CNNM domain-containing protein n=1 Tax=Helicobacter sp. MIT 03-1614 TaxID=1548147 RepID=UPI00051471FB|nr:CNNM domain-containing protein [Helicobacter sp. MIT 03-1614]TLD88923.1 DUF21 domain-containing protein [Helicobacter sp. MIT 03-1614]